VHAHEYNTLWVVDSATFLVASPRDAAHARVSFDAGGQPSAPDIAHASERLVHISIELTEP